MFSLPSMMMWETVQHARLCGAKFGNLKYSAVEVVRAVKKNGLTPPDGCVHFWELHRIHMFIMLVVCVMGSHQAIETNLDGWLLCVGYCLLVWNREAFREEYNLTC